MGQAAPAVDAPTPAFAGRALGSALRLFVRGPDGRAPLEATSAWAEVLAEFDAVDTALSRFRDDSELTRLNRMAGTGSVVPASWRLRETLAAMHRASRVTGGRFDPTVLSVLESLGERGACLEEADVGLRGGGDEVERPSRVRAPGRPVDSGGIGKGLALRWAVRRAGAAVPGGCSLLLDAGGDLVAARTGGHDDGAAVVVDPWLIGVEDPLAPQSDPDRPIAVIAMTTGAVATSSVRVRRWHAPDGRLVHHLVDPATGAPATTGLLAVTVANADPAWAEVWSKALFLAGRTAIADEARARGFAAWWIDDGGRLGMTPAARERSVWVDERRIG
jgi:thiamine biosynthesis lipoprotein